MNPAVVTPVTAIRTAAGIREQGHDFRALGPSFASLLEKEDQQPPEVQMELYAPATDAGSNPSQNRDRQFHGHAPLETMESVKSVGIPLKKRQDTGTSLGGQNDATGQQFSKKSAAFAQNSDTKDYQKEPEKAVTIRNNEEITASSTISAPQLTPAMTSMVAASAIPDSEMKKLVRVLRNSSLSKRASVFLTLDLKEMGEVKLDVTLHANKVYISAVIADRRAAAALSFAMGELRKQLAAIDLTLEKFEFRTLSSGHSAGANAPGIHAHLLGRTGRH